jgi:hypothetical protein
MQRKGRYEGENSEYLGLKTSPGVLEIEKCQGETQSPGQTYMKARRELWGGESHEGKRRRREEDVN